MAKAIHTMIRVLDEARSLAFYKKAFGLDIADRLDFPDFTLVYLSNSETPYEVELTINKDRTEPYNLGDGYGHVAFVVDDLDAEHRRFEAEGLKPRKIVEFNNDGKADRALFLRRRSGRLQDRGAAEARPLPVAARAQQILHKKQEETPMTATETTPREAGLSRRGFLQRSASGFAAAIAITSTGALLNVSEAWALDVKGLKPETMKTLILVARDIYPHDKVADRYYAIAMKGYDDKAAGNPEMKAEIEGFVAALDGAAGEGGYVGRPWEADRVAILRNQSADPMFETIRSGLVVSLYNQKEIWPIFGYEGESFSKGGYIERGFDDISWL